MPEQTRTEKLTILDNGIKQSVKVRHREGCQTRAGIFQDYGPIAMCPDCLRTQFYPPEVRSSPNAKFSRQKVTN